MYGYDSDWMVEASANESMDGESVAHSGFSVGFGGVMGACSLVISASLPTKGGGIGGQLLTLFTVLLNRGSGVFVRYVSSSNTSRVLRSAIEKPKALPSNILLDSVKS
jgi:hypothetical protein